MWKEVLKIRNPHPCYKVTRNKVIISIQPLFLLFFIIFYKTFNETVSKRKDVNNTEAVRTYTMEVK